MCALSPQGNCPKVSSINDRNDWKLVRKALTVIGFNEDEVEVKTRTLHVKPPCLGSHQCIVGAVKSRISQQPFILSQIEPNTCDS